MPSESQRVRFAGEAHGSRERVSIGEQREMLAGETDVTQDGAPPPPSRATQTALLLVDYELSWGYNAWTKAIHIFVFCLMLDFFF